MKKLIFVLPAFLFLTLFSCPSAKADFSDEMKFLGFSSELRDYVSDQIKKTNNFDAKNESSDNSAFQKQLVSDGNESDALLEQLTELGKTRKLGVNSQIKSEKVKADLDGFWKSMSIRDQSNDVKLPDSIRENIKNSIQNKLSGLGYTIKQMDLIDVPPNLGIPQARLVLRVVRPLKSKNSYKEIQGNLAEVRGICLNEATIEGICYLSELTTFVAENPKNNYYYEKTVLTAAN
ncbi:MAG: hypothetical protein HQM10_17485 [Candidatus Riflebacteria bacterium]|nr:hypothetical protein [Candidatus Riflebacteria bacterium]